MVNPESLSRRARTSPDGEAYVAITKAAGYRVGAGARAVSGRDPEFFVEVVLDPFPDRPAVDPGSLAAQGAVAERLRRRGYALTCDDAGILTCERTVTRSSLGKEVREVPLLLAGSPRRKRACREPVPPDEAS